jgi:hypothetical protein
MQHLCYKKNAIIYQATVYQYTKKSRAGFYTSAAQTYEANLYNK